MHLRRYCIHGNCIYGGEDKLMLENFDNNEDTEKEEEEETSEEVEEILDILSKLEAKISQIIFW
ncbi:hypothetical protein C2G38_2164155 [Gigaspora rosea]|uniref:Uncharacterized protein n=1 Tax=Gigaspora rosea TaxID=44941 RepID=A0A397VU90_9GLOM|nr:hypothetical protein C2G38_2164155 [Gigaspora rosea]